MLSVRSLHAGVPGHEILRGIEHEWSTELGAKAFTELKALLLRVWKSPLVR